MVEDSSMASVSRSATTAWRTLLFDVAAEAFVAGVVVVASAALSPAEARIRFDGGGSNSDNNEKEEEDGDDDGDSGAVAAVVVDSDNVLTADGAVASVLGGLCAPIIRRILGSGAASPAAAPPTGSAVVVDSDNVLTADSAVASVLGGLCAPIIRRILGSGAATTTASASDAPARLADDDWATPAAVAEAVRRALFELPELP